MERMDRKKSESLFKVIYQFHLSTAIVLMLAVDFVIGMNAHHWNPESPSLGGPVFTQGWPFAFCDVYVSVANMYRADFYLRAAIADVCISAMIICVVAVTSEFIVRASPQ